MEKTEKAQELLQRAKELGVRVEFQSGAIILKYTAAVDPKAITSMAEELVKYLPEVRVISKARAVAALARTLVSRRIWTREHGAGTLVDASDDGMLTIQIGAETRKSDEEEGRRVRHAITADAESVLILDEVQADTSIANDEAISEQPKMGIFERLRRG